MNSRTRPLPGSVLVAVPTAAWAMLVAVTWILTAVGERPAGGWFTVGAAVAITITIVALTLWAIGDAKAHLSAELATLYRMLSHRIDSLDREAPTGPILAAVGMASVVPPPLPVAPDPKVVEIGRHLARKITDG